MAINPTEGDDTLIGTNAPETIDGLGGDDSIDGGNGTDVMIGGPGDDFITGGTRNLWQDYNIADYRAATGPIVASLGAVGTVTGDASVGTDTLGAIGAVRGTDFDDTIEVFGDWSGQYGPDSNWIEIMPGAGDDTVSGHGNVRISYGFSPRGVVVDFATGTASDGYGSTDTFSGVNSVRGSNSNDKLYGTNRGWESFRGQNGTDRIDGREGYDRVDYGNSPAGVKVNLSKGQALNDGWGKKDTLISIEGIRGSQYFDDLLIGNNLDNHIDAREGDDTVKGLGGEDTLIGGEGNDRVDGGGGGDRIVGNAGDDTLIGGAYAWSAFDPRANNGDWDTLDYGNSPSATTVNLMDGTATADGSPYSDRISNFEQVIGSDYADSFIGGQPGANFESFVGGGGNDTLDASQSAEPFFWMQAEYRDAVGGVTATLWGMGGTVSGPGVGTDTLIGLQYVVGSDYNDAFNASAFAEGSDGSSYNRFRGGPGDDTVIGNGNTDLDFIDGWNAGGLGLSIDLKTGVVDAAHLGLGVDSFSGADRVRGTQLNDTLVGGATEHDDRESFNGRRGDDIIDGGSGYDKALYHNENGAITVDLAAGTVTVADGTGTDTLRSVEGIRGTLFNDLFDARGFGDASSNAGSLGTFNLFEPRTGNDTVIGNGDTRVDYHTTSGGVKVDLKKGLATGNSSIGKDKLTDVAHASGTRFDDVIIGNALDNQLEGRLGNDILTGGAGNDLFFGTAEELNGDRITDLWSGDVIKVEGASFETEDMEVIPGSAILNIDLDDDDIADTTITLDGKFVGAGYFVATDHGSGEDAYTEIEFIEGGHTDSGLPGDETINGTWGPDSLAGAGGNDWIMADAGNDTVAGGPGDDTIVGGNGAGNDQYFGDAGIDVITFAGATNKVTVGLARGTASGKETGKDALDGIENVIGGAGNDHITGDNKANVIDGGPGADRMTGGGDDDTYIVDNIKDKVVEKKDGGDTDTLHIESLLGVKAGKPLVFALPNYVETVEIMPGAGAVQVKGGADDNEITGNDEANKLDGGKGADTMAGGLGDDTYWVDDAGDMVNELAGEGIDAVVSTIDHTLGDHVENLTLAGKKAVTAIGNAANNIIAGNAKGNAVDGGGGDDEITGGKGKDTVLASLGDDTMTDFKDRQDKVDLWAFTRSMGADVAEWDNLKTDHLGEDSDGNAMVDFSPGNTLTLLGVDKDALEADDFLGVTTGSYVGGDGIVLGFETDDILVGGNGSDTLTAGAGNDTVLAGGGDDLIVAASGPGNDVYRGEDGGDTATFESATKPVSVSLTPGKKTGMGSAKGKEIGTDVLDGIEHVIGGDGNDNITGDDGDNDLAGGAGKDTLNGGDGADTLTGGLGRDLLIGGNGADAFAYGSLDDSPVGKKFRDTIKGFNPVEDVIDLPVDVAYIGADPFTGAGGETRFHKGVLQVDADGDTAVDIEIALAGVKPEILGSNPNPDWLM